MVKIRNKRELAFFIKADRMMNTGRFKPALLDRLIDNHIMHYLVAMRKYAYFSHQADLLSKVYAGYYKIRLKKFGEKLNFSIGPDTLGYGVRIPHYGTIVVGNRCSIGKYAVLHTSICITGNRKVIGDGLYVSTGAKLTSVKTLSNNVTIAANSVVTKSFEESNILLVGMPATFKKTTEAWYEKDEVYNERVRLIEELKQKMNL